MNNMKSLPLSQVRLSHECMVIISVIDLIKIPAASGVICISLAMLTS